MNQTLSIEVVAPALVPAVNARGLPVGSLPADIEAANQPIRPLELVFRSRDALHAGLRRHLLALDCSVADPQSFQCHAVLASLGGNSVAELRVDAARLVRRTVDIDAAEAALVHVVWQLAGRSRVRQGPHQATLDAGTWAVCDPAREYAIEFDRGARVLTLLVPRTQCPGWLPALGLLAARALPSRGPAHIAMAALAAMLRDEALLDAQSDATLHDSIVALVERALAIELAARGLEAQAERTIQLARVQAYILEHLADPGLNVGRVAGVFGVSRRSLYNLFEPSGVAPHAFIQSAKLDRACELLHQPASRKISVAGIARQCGFADPAHFSRAFHARHGVAPTAWRDQVQ
jgi:AraC family transcriptional regulator, positive regulator of tynA and feaB